MKNTALIKKLAVYFLAVIIIFPVFTPLSAKAATSGTCGYNLTWVLDDTGTLTISGTGGMTYWSSSSSVPWSSNRSSIEKVAIKNGVTSIGSNAFYDCESLTSISIPSGVTSIGRYAFGGCESLTSISIPDSVTSIGDYVFWGCSSLTAIVVDEANKKYSNDECGALFNKDKITLIQYPAGNKATSYEIPTSVTSIGDSAFSGCGSLTEISIPSGVTNIDDYVFLGCSSLTSIEIPEGVTSIGFGAFYECSSLSSIELPTSVTSIGWRAFEFCSSLTEISIPLGVTSISVYAFSSCDSLESISIPSSVTSIGEYAFSGCSSLSSLEIPNSVINIDAYAFLNCSGLTTVTFAEGSKLTSIDYAVFWGCSSLAEINIPTSVTIIGSSAFRDCSSLTEICIPSGVNSIWGFAFSGCSSLTEISIPSSVTNIDGYVFWGCSSLSSIEIPEGVTSIGDSAFRDCSRLTSISIPSSVTSIGDCAFYGCSSLTDVYYWGSEEEWEDISIGNENESLTGATIHFNYKPEGGDTEDSETGSEGSFSSSTSKGAPIIKSVILTYNGKEYNLFSQPVTIESESSAEVSIKAEVDFNGLSDVKLYITQTAEKYVEIENVTEKTFAPAEKFSSGKDIYLLAVDNKTGKSTSRRLKLNISERASGEFLPTGGVEGLNFKLGNETGFTIPDSMPIFAGTEIKWSFDFIPVSVEYDREDNNKINVVFGTKIVSSDGEEDKYFEDFDFKDYKEKFKKAATKQGRTLKQLRHDFRMTKGKKMNLFGGKVIGGGKGEPSFDVDVAGYAEMKVIDGELKFIEGQICLEAEVSYTYKGQLFIMYFPVYYEIGGGIGAGFEGDMINIDPESFTPQLEAYITAKIKANIGGGIGVPKFATVGASGKGSLNLKTALHKKYLKSWGEGEANFNLKLFGKTVGELPFAKGDFLIYETGSSEGLIKDNSVTIQSAENIFSGIDLNETYENESRSYLSEATTWHGDSESVNLMSAEYTNKNLNMLAENVYTESAPIISMVNGKKIMVMLWDNNKRDDVNRTMVVYSLFDDESGLWSAPLAVDDDGTADFYPCFKDGYLVWQNEKSLLNDDMTLAEIAALGEICVAKWNGEGFDKVAALTDNDSLDTYPVVASDGENVSVIWTSNSENDILGLSGTNTIKKCDFAATNYNESTVAENLSAVTNLSAEYIDGKLKIAYVEDEDNDLSTINDRDIKIISEEETKNITDNETLDSNPYFSGDSLYYYSDGNIICYSFADSKSEAVFNESKAGLSDSFSVYTNQDGITGIWWAKAVEGGSEISALYREGEVWSDEIKIVGSEKQFKYPSGILEEDGSMYLAYNEGTWENGDIIKTDLYTVSVVPSYDLTVTDAYTDEETVFAVIKNTGELTIDSFDIVLNDGKENNRLTIDEPIAAGDVKEVEIEYIKPESLIMKNVIFSVEASDVEEYNLNNNRYELTIGKCDIRVDEVICFETLPESKVVTALTNVGGADASDVTVSLRKNSKDGEVIATEEIELVKAGETKEVAIKYNPGEYDNVLWYITAETETEEAYTINNSAYFINECAVDLEDYELSVLSQSYADNTLTVNAYAKNNTKEKLLAEALFTAYGSDGEKKATTTQSLDIEAYSDTGIDVWFENYSYADGDYVEITLKAKDDSVCGDLNLDGTIDINDAVLLFRHSLMPERYPINYSGDIDFTDDGQVDINDAVLLFRHSLMPDRYPIS